MEIRLLESAKEDLRGGWHFYEAKTPGLGNYFLDCLQADIHSLTIYAGVHSRVADYHRMLSNRFPFAIYYRIDGERVDVYAILDCRRDPDWIVKRLRDA